MDQTWLDQVWVITGATSGLGRATALELARCGASVITLNRDAAKGAALRAALAAESGHDRHAVYTADLADLAAVRRAAADLTAAHPQLDGLINNAGVSLGRRQLTPQGHETTLAVNFLAPFLLTHRLLPALRAAAHPPARVINLATWKHPPLEFDDLERAQHFDAQAVYGQSKTALVMFTQDLARRCPDLRVNAVNPGLVRTNIGTGLTGLNWLFIKVIAPLTMMVPPAQGAQRVLRLVDDPALADATGQFIYEDHIAPPFETEPSAADRARLWQLAEHLTGLPA